MQHSLSPQADSSLASQEIPHILRHSQVHGSFHNSLPLVSILSNTNPLYSVQFNSIYFVHLIQKGVVTHRI